MRRLNYENAKDWSVEATKADRSPHWSVEVYGGRPEPALECGSLRRLAGTRTGVWKSTEAGRSPHWSVEVYGGRPEPALECGSLRRLAGARTGVQKSTEAGRSLHWSVEVYGGWPEPALECGSLRRLAGARTGVWKSTEAGRSAHWSLEVYGGWPERTLECGWSRKGVRRSLAISRELKLKEEKACEGVRRRRGQSRSAQAPGASFSCAERRRPAKRQPASRAAGLPPGRGGRGGVLARCNS